MHHLHHLRDQRPRPPMPRSDSIRSALLDHHGTATIIEVSDAAHDPQLRLNEFVGHDGMPIRFYAAAPLAGPDGTALGTLCAIAHHPRQLSELQRRLLLHLGYAAAQLLTSAPHPPRG